MSQVPKPAIRVRVDLTNPGQFFACCGLLELADRLWGEAQGWFAEQNAALYFLIGSTLSLPDISPSTLIDAIAKCSLANTMTEFQMKRHKELSSMPKKLREGDTALEAEKKALDALWREAPIRLGAPFDLLLNWFADEYSGGENFKTWAGQQSVLEIARAMKKSLESGDWNTALSEDWLVMNASTTGPFYFDSDIGGIGSDRDVGFSFDPLKIRLRTRPLIEFAAFVGLQRFRPTKEDSRNLYRYLAWFDPLVPQVASAAACGALGSTYSRAYQFQLYYRTKYLKSFLPAKPFRGEI